MAAPIILKIDEIAPEDFPFYFFDANIWVAIIGQMGGNTAQANDRPYLDFWTIVVNIHERKGTPLLEKKTKHFPKIVIPAVLLSETINALINIHGKTYLADNPSIVPPGRSFSFKRDYRPLDDYKKKLRQILSDFHALEAYLEFRDDGFGQSNILGDFSTYNSDFDFNDYLYAKMFRGTNIPIVTHDADFGMFPDITIITANPKLLKIK